MPPVSSLRLSIGLVLMTSSLLERKWRVFEKRVKLFRHVPFVEFVLLAGSMATGRIHEDSDFDVIVGVREGRVFTAWFFSALLFQLRGWREHPGTNQSDRFGMSHFVAPDGYKLSPPYDPYWQNLYQKLIPVLGDEKKMAQFFSANDWLEPKRAYKRHEKYLISRKSFYKHYKEFELGGRLGNFVERRMKRRLVEKRIKDPKKLGYKPRVHWDDHKLELYRDTKRIEEMLEGGEL